MTKDWNYQDRAVLRGVAAGAVSVGAVMIAVGLMAFPGSSSDMQRAEREPSADASPSGLVSSAAAAVRGDVPLVRTPPNISGDDSRLNDYQLERDSCCVGN